MAEIESGRVQVELLEDRPKLDLVSRRVTAKAVEIAKLEIDRETGLPGYRPVMRR
jgi:hypothetical protein